MKKIETLEQLKAEKQRLNIAARQMENELQEDFKYFSSRIQPLLSIFDGSSSSGQTSSLLLKGVAAVVPLLLSQRKSDKSTPSKPSPWLAIGSTVLGLLVSKQGFELLGKLGGVFNSFKSQRKKRKYKHHVPSDSKE